MLNILIENKQIRTIHFENFGYILQYFFKYQIKNLYIKKCTQLTKYVYFIEQSIGFLTQLNKINYQILFIVNRNIILLQIKKFKQFISNQINSKLIITTYCKKKQMLLQKKYFTNIEDFLSSSFQSCFELQINLNYNQIEASQSVLDLGSALKNYTNLLVLTINLRSSKIGAHGASNLVSALGNCFNLLTLTLDLGYKQFFVLNIFIYPFYILYLFIF
ncbi:transmembrane protein, putative (macronuclear) [Tetrahymena thermophila SB210]|uniref:Transmembrane protein, putative n=1 Tax=Tetrahymena thermophila (strain SB210) TaxID=312017 RepID=W7XEJ6_TETTS|nr:transmembrane protein, putative [Tetrahymena thermophila SB210]EWS76157.1 transmembrane protein, putative [Tetrahymena thermophila SB210]|eukprot:XP_012651310.1 transmembrane protein, putative [Tetrahymena thermophila SB210]